MATSTPCTGFSSTIQHKKKDSLFFQCKNWWCKIKKWTLGVILQKLNNCVCVLAELCKWQMSLCTSKPCNVHPASVLLWKRGRRDRERHVKRWDERTGEYYSTGSLFILWAKPVFQIFNTKKQEDSKLNSSLMTLSLRHPPNPVKKVSVTELLSEKTH